MSKKIIPLSIPVIGGNELKYVKDCLDSGWISSVGSYVNRFEEDICRRTGAKHAIACVNGTAALHTALLLAGVKAHDEVIVPTITFIASVNAVSYVNASPVFMDCDDFYNIDPVKTKEFIETRTVMRGGFSYNRKTKKRVAALMVVHVFGNAADIEGLRKLCRARNIRLIEDAAESLGTYYRKNSLAGRHTGTVGDVGCFSFNGNKIISTGGGGMIVTDNAALARRARYLTTQAKDDALRYIHGEVGFNYRLNNIQAAVGVAQMELLPKYLQIKQQNFDLYRARIDLIQGLKLVRPPSYAQNNHWFYCLQIDKKVYGLTADQVMSRLIKNGIEVRPIWDLNHLQKPYRGFEAYKIKKAYDMLEKTVNIPCSVSLTREEIFKITELLNAWKK